MRSFFAIYYRGHAFSCTLRVSSCRLPSWPAPSFGVPHGLLCFFTIVQISEFEIHEPQLGSRSQPGAAARPRNEAGSPATNLRPTRRPSSQGLRALAMDLGPFGANATVKQIGKPFPAAIRAPHRLN